MSLPILILPHNKSPEFAAWQTSNHWQLRTYFEHGAEKIFSKVATNSPFHLARTFLPHSIDDIVACTYGKPRGQQMSLADQLGFVASTKSTRRSFEKILQQSVLSTPLTTYQADYKDP